MRILGLALAVGISVGPVFAGQDGTDTFTAPGTAPSVGDKDTPASAEPAPGKDTERAKKGGSSTPQGLTFAEIVGAWTGTVDEIDQDPYTINLTFRPGGLGEVSYTGYDCGGVLGPVSEGAKLVFKETITTGREICADGAVEITPSGAGLNWTWINEWNEVQATAVLRRK